MKRPKTVLITGASGNLGAKLRQHLEGRYPLKLVDIDAQGDSRIVQADLSSWTGDWRDQFQGVDVVVHFAADPTAYQTWPKLIKPNLDLLINVYQASVEAGVKRMIYASSNHVMGGYQNIAEPDRITTDIPPQPGTHYISDGQPRDSTPYGSAKLFGERLGRCFAEIHGLSVIAVRIGWVKPGDNRPVDLPVIRGSWFRLMWLSNRDFCHLMERCIEAELAIPFAIINGMSANTGMRWDIEYTRELVGYQPQDDVMRG
jgi:nucleoside-diphosphate-sugar epimerase